MIIDELIALLGFRTDEGSANKAKSALSGVEAAAGKLAGALGAAGLAAGFVKLVEYGHAASETMERLDTVFGPAGEGVKEWSDAFGKEVGRSRQDLQQMTAGVGAMVAPMGVSQGAAAEMGKGLAELAVNLAELNNAEDSQTMDALRMGLTGNTRALKQYGIVVDEADMQEAARQLGIRKGIKTLTDAERAQVSYQAILNKSAGVAKAGLDPTEAFDARIQNLRDSIGLKLLPVAEWLAEKALVIIDYFEDLAKNTNLVEVAFAVLAPVAAAAAWSMIAPFLPAIALFAAIVLIVEDLVTMFQGGDSVIGRFLDSMGGAGTAAAIVETLKDAWGEAVRLFQDNWPMIKEGFAALVSGIGSAFDGLKAFGEWLGSFIFDAVQWIDQLIEKFESLASSMPDLGKLTDLVGGGLSDIGNAALNLVGMGEPSAEQVRVQSGSSTSNKNLTTGLTVVNNFNGVKPGEVDAKLREAAGNTGQLMGRQLRDATAGAAR